MGAQKWWWLQSSTAGRPSYGQLILTFSRGVVLGEIFAKILGLEATLFTLGRRHHVTLDDDVRVQRPPKQRVEPQKSNNNDDDDHA